jgi:VWFA-related protein
VKRQGQPLHRSLNRDGLRREILETPLFGTDLTPDSSRERAGCYCGLCSLEALGNVIESLGAVHDQRKLLVFISAGSMLEHPSSNRSDNSPDQCIQRKRDAMHDALRRAHAANVTIEAFDPRGLITLPPPRRSASLPGFGPPQPLGDQPSMLRLEFLKTVAESTGGHAVVNNNEPERQVRTVLAESSSYYLLGVERPSPRNDGRLRRIEVQVARRGVTVRTRGGYYDDSTAK